MRRMVTYLHKFLEGNVQNELFISVAFTSQSRVSNEQIAHGKACGFIARIATRVLDLVAKIHHFAVVP